MLLLIISAPLLISCVWMLLTQVSLRSSASCRARILLSASEMINKLFNVYIIYLHHFNNPEPKWFNSAHVIASHYNQGKSPILTFCLVQLHNKQVNYCIFILLGERNLSMANQRITKNHAGMGMANWKNAGRRFHGTV